MSVLTTLALRHEQDIVVARQRAREVAGLLGFSQHDQTRITTAVSEIARNAFLYAREGKVAFGVDALQGQQVLAIRVSDSGPGIADLEHVLSGHYRSRTGMGIGLVGARRLVDDCEIHSRPGQGTQVVLRMALPAGVTEPQLARIAIELTDRPPRNANEELQQQNQELVRLLGTLRERQEEMLKLNRELEDTNRGVVALYAELDEKADSLRRADETKTRFLSNMTHEFRTPVNSIRALAGILLDRTDGELNAEQERQVQFINRAAEDLAILVDDLLDIAKIEAGKVEVHADDVAVDTVFSALRGMFRPLMPSGAVSLVFEEPHGIPPMHTDERKLSQILRNLISNALKYTEQGEVRVAARYLAAEQAVCFSVADTGIGIAPQDHERVFEEFLQVANPLQKRAKGTGLGLPLCRRLAVLLGGSLTLQSEPGSGSTFSAILPVRYAAGRHPAQRTWPQAPHAQAPAVMAGPRRPDVLIIDDEESSRYVLARLLAEHAVRVHEAVDGVAGLRRARALRPGLIFLDLNMPRRSGRDVLADLRKDARTREIPVVVVSNFPPGSPDLQELKGATAVVPKDGLTPEAVKNALALAAIVTHPELPRDRP